MRGHMTKDEISTNWRDLIQARFTKFSFNVVLLGEGETAMRLHAGVGCVPAGF